MTDPPSLAELSASAGAIGERSLRPWRPDDAAALVAAWKDETVARWNPVPATPTIEVARRWIDSTVDQNAASRTLDLVLVDAADRILGEIGFQITDDRRWAEVGFWVDATSRRQGVARDLLTLGLTVLWSTGVARCVALVDPENMPASALLTSLGWPEVETTSSRRGFVAPQI